jgi:hypothetical protein
MMRELNHLFFWVSMFIPVFFAGFVWFGPLAFARWAKIASLLGAAASVGWDIITLCQQPLAISRYPFLLTVSIKQSLAGIAVGIMITILIARPWHKIEETPKHSNDTSTA